MHNRVGIWQKTVMMVYMKRFLKWLLLLSVALTVSVAVLLFNPGLLKQPLERYLGKVTGYSILLDGDIDIDIGGSTEFTARKIKVASPRLSQQPNLAELGELKIALLLSSVFKDEIIIESLQLDSLQLMLETDSDGNGNWQIPRQEPIEKNESVNNRRVVINNITISNTDLRFNNGKNETGHILLIESLHQQQQQDGMLHTELNGLLNNRLIEYSGRMGPYDNILNGRDIRFESEGHFGELKISGKGLIDSIYEPKNPTFMLNLEGPNIDEITAMLGIDDLGGGGFFLSAKGGQIKDHFEAGITGNIGDVSLQLSAQASDVTHWENLDLSASGNGPNLGAVMRIFGTELWPDKPFSFKTKIKKTGRTLDVSELVLNIGGTRLQADALLSRFPELSASHIKLKISGEDISQLEGLLGISGLGQGKFDIKGKLNVSPEGVELVQVDMESPQGSASISGNLGEAPTYQGSTFRLVFNGPNAQALLLGLKIKALPDSPFNLNADLELVDNGIRIDQAVLLSNDKERHSLSGLVAFNPGLEGSELDVNVSGENLSRFLWRMEIPNTAPEGPYQLSSKVKILKNGLELIDTRTNFESTRLNANGLIAFENQLTGSFLNFDIEHENISNLSDFEIIGNSLDIFVPGLFLQASGRLDFEERDWKLGNINGRLGNTAFDFDASISKTSGMAGSKIRFSVSGPETQALFSEKISSKFAPGPFKAAGQVELSDKSMIVEDLVLNTASTQGQLDFEMAWPISDVLNVHFDIDAQGQDIRNVLPMFDSFQAAKTNFRLTAEGKIENDAISLKSFNAGVGNLDLDMVGQVRNDPGDSNVEFTLIAKSPDISSLGYFNGEALPGMPFEINADFSGNARLFSIQNLVGSLGDSNLTGTLDVSLLEPRPSIKVVAQSDLIDFAPFSELIQDDQPEDKATDASPKDRLIRAIPLPLDLLNSVDIDADIKIVELKLKNSSLKNLNLDLDLLDGNLQLHELFLNAPGGTLKTSMSIQPLDAQSASVKLDMQASNLFFNLSGVPANRLNEIPEWNVDVHAVGVGGNLQELAGSANGDISIKSAGGLLEGLDLSLLDFFVLEEISNLLMPKSQQTRNEQLTCSASILNIEDGMVKTNPAITFSTERIAIISKGTLNLKNEKLNFNFNAIPQKAIKISAGEIFNPFILIGGTLANPSVGLDPQKTILHGGMAIGTMGISVLAKGVIDRMGNTAPLCEELLNSPSQP